MCIYQFLIAVRQDGNVLQNEDGETTRYNHHNTDRPFTEYSENSWHVRCAVVQLLDVFFPQPSHGNVLPDNPHAGTRHQTRVRVWWQAPTAQVSRGQYGIHRCVVNEHLHLLTPSFQITSCVLFFWMLCQLFLHPLILRLLFSSPSAWEERGEEGRSWEAVGSSSGNRYSWIYRAVLLCMSCQ